MKKNFTAIISYFNILYFLEIINIILILLVAYGKPLSICAGFILTVLLSLHIIRIYFDKGSSRKIQLYMMDIHLAYSVPFFIFIMIDGINNSLLDYFFIFTRFTILCAEIMFIYLLTDEKFIGRGIQLPQA